MSLRPSDIDRELVPVLLAWYRRSRRDLPWRDTDDPYRIWVSEIILQQTRVAQGTAYYHRFLERFPTVEALAGASVDEVLKMWEGLGYYSRARNMHAAARAVMRDHAGHFPQRAAGLLRLPGIGPYTAAAIASIAFGEAVPVLDGNVFRVIARLFAVALPRGTAGDREVSRITRQLIPADAPGDFNQALMELGALICLPRDPRCGECPLSDRCMARREKRLRELPVTSPPPKTEKRYFHYFVMHCGDEILVTQRTRKDIWRLLWEFPALEMQKEISPEEALSLFEKEMPGITGESITATSSLIRHQLTHRTILARFCHIHLKKWPRSLKKEWKKISVDEMKELAFPRLITAYMESYPLRFRQ